MVLHLSLTHVTKMAWRKLHKMHDVSKVGLVLVVCLDEMIGTERGPQQKKGRGAREVELGIPFFNDTCNTRGKLHKMHDVSKVGLLLALCF